MRVLALGFAAYVGGVVALSALAVYLLLPLAAGLRASDRSAPIAVAVIASTAQSDEARPAEAPAAPVVAAPTEPFAPTVDSFVDAPPEPSEPVIVAALAIVDEPTPEPEIEWSHVAKLDRLMTLVTAARDPESVAPATAPEVAVLLQRGNALLATGDVASARLFYGRAAERGDAAGAIGLAKTYDPLFLAEAGFRTARGNAGEAIAWYRRARDAGSTEAAPRLDRLLSHTAVAHD